MLPLLPLYRKTAAALCSQIFSFTVRFLAGGYDPSRGAGFGGGGGGTIRNAGGTFAKLGNVREEQFYINQQDVLIKKLKNRRITLDEYHTKRIKILEEYSKLVDGRK